ncbi:MAG: hypothetical protein KAQ63_00030 [Candidatus Moranbacteria bacterium]|nr:hypothetical protein [Candidatus Moranbacteria bacterium]
MKKTTKHILSFAVLAVVFSLPLITGAQFSPDQGQGGTGLESTSVYDIIVTILNWLLLLITVLAVIGFVVSGVMFVTAGGSERGEDAKKWLQYSIIGIIVALIGYIVVNVVSSILGGTVQT